MNEYRPPLPPVSSGGQAFPEAAGYPAADDADSPSAALWHFLRVLRRQAWKIAGFVFAVVAATLLYSLQLTPMYEATATLELEGLNQMVRLGSELVGYNFRQETKVIETQLRLINSPEIASAVARDLGLDRSPLFGYTGKGEPVRVKSLPGLSAEMIPNTYLLAITYRAPSPELARDVANSVAKAYIEQGYESRYENARNLQSWLDKQLEDLRARSERAQQKLLDYEQKHNLVRSEGRADLVQEELSRLQADLIQTQAERVRKELDYKSVERGDVGDLLVSTEGSPVASLVSQRENLEIQLAEASAHYGPNHPAYKKLEARIGELDRLIDRARGKVLERLQAEYREVVRREEALRERYLEKKRQVDRLSELAVEYGSLKREAAATTALYEQLLKTVNEVGLQSTIQETNLRIAAPAKLPGNPVYPDIPHNVLTAFLFSLALGIAAAIAGDLLDRTVRNTEQVEQWLRVPVLANLPLLAGSRRPQNYLLPAAFDSEKHPKRTPQEAHALVEGFTMLRTSLLLTAGQEDLRVLLVSSAVPAEGKTTVASGLAAALAQQVRPGEEVLLVDGDLRRPTLHTAFGISNRKGVVDLLTQQGAIDDYLQTVDSLPALKLLPRGPGTSQSNELIMSRMGTFLEEARARFRYVILDSAPLLASADSTVLATLTDGVVLVARAGGTSRDMVAAAFKQVKRVRGNVLGMVLNQVSKRDQAGYHYYYSGYYYQEENA